MDRSHFSIPAMQLQARFGDRVVPVFCERPHNIWAMISDTASRNPDGEALVCGDTRMNWREVVQRSEQIAAGFHRLGLHGGDRVAVLLGNRIEFVLTLFAAAHAGLVTVLLGTRQQKPEIAYVLTDCGAKLLIHEAQLADMSAARARMTSSPCGDGPLTPVLSSATRCSTGSSSTS